MSLLVSPLIFLCFPDPGFLGMMGPGGVSLGKDQEPPQGDFKHLKLAPDGLVRNFSPHELN